MAQSALSKRVKRLENRVGTHLFDRHARGVYLTEMGKIFFDKALGIIDDLSSLEKELSFASEKPFGKVRVALPQRTSGILGPKIIKRKMNELENVDLDIFEGSPLEIHNLLNCGEVDVALSYGNEVSNNYSSTPIMVEPLFLFCHKRILKEIFTEGIPEKISFHDLEKIPLIMPRKPHIVRVMLDRLSNLNHVKTKIIFETNGNSLVRGAVQEGIAATIFSTSSDSWNNLTSSGEVAFIPFKSPLVSWSLFLIRSKNSENITATNKIISIIDEEINKLIEGNYWPNAKRIF